MSGVVSFIESWQKTTLVRRELHELSVDVVPEEV